jgi:hypothetical protein
VLDAQPPRRPSNGPSDSFEPGDVIKSKTTAARPKDLDALPELIDIARARDRAQNPGDR